MRSRLGYGLTHTCTLLLAAAVVSLVASASSGKDVLRWELVESKHESARKLEAYQHYEIEPGRLTLRTTDETRWQGTLTWSEPPKLVYGEEGREDIPGIPMHMRLVGRAEHSRVIIDLYKARGQSVPVTRGAQLYLDASLHVCVTSDDGSQHDFPGAKLAVVARSIPAGAEATAEETFSLAFPTSLSDREVTFTLELNPFVNCREKYLYRYQRKGVPATTVQPKPEPPEKKPEVQPRILPPQGVVDSVGNTQVERGLIPITMTVAADPKLNLGRQGAKLQIDHGTPMPAKGASDTGEWVWEIDTTQWDSMPHVVDGYVDYAGGPGLARSNSVTLRAFDPSTMQPQTPGSEIIASTVSAARFAFFYRIYLELDYATAHPLRKAWWTWDSLNADWILEGAPAGWALATEQSFEAAKGLGMFFFMKLLEMKISSEAREFDFHCHGKLIIAAMQNTFRYENWKAIDELPEDRRLGAIRELARDYDARTAGKIGEYGRGDERPAGAVPVLHLSSALECAKYTEYWERSGSAETPTMVVLRNLYGLHRAELEQKAVEIQLHSPARLHAYDAQKRHVGRSPQETIDTNIPGVRYLPAEGKRHETILAINPPPGLSFEIQGLADGRFAASLFTLDVAAACDVVARDYPPVNCQRNLRAQIKLDPAAAAVMRIDRDTDGKQDEAIQSATRIVPTTIRIATRGASDRATATGTPATPEAKSKPVSPTSAAAWLWPLAAIGAVLVAWAIPFPREVRRRLALLAGLCTSAALLAVEDRLFGPSLSGAFSAALWAPTGVAILAYLFVPTPALPGKHRYDAASAVLIPDLLGASLTTFFFVLPLLIIPSVTDGLDLCRDGWWMLTATLWLMAAVTSSINAVAAWYSMRSIGLEHDTLVASTLWQTIRIPYEEIQSVEAFRVAAPRWLVLLGLTISLFNWRATAPSLLLMASTDRGLTVRGKHARVNILEAELEGLYEIVTTLRARATQASWNVPWWDEISTDQEC